MSDWLRSAADLLREEDPGPTPFLVDGLIVDGAVAVIQGPPKVSKTYAVLELARAIVTGQRAFGRFGILECPDDEGPVEGAVIVLLEESGEKALHRRLDALARGNAQPPEAFENLYYGANLGIQLDREDWQARLLRAVAELDPLAVFLDPLVRMKGAGRDENSQLDMGPVLEFLRELRRESDILGRAVVYVHHTGHEGTRQRGSSDLEAFWESKLSIRLLDDGTREVTSEHREAESGAKFRYRMDFDTASRSLRLSAVADDLKTKVAEYLAGHPDASKNEVVENVGGNRQTVLALVDEVRSEGGSSLGNHPEPPLPGPLSARGSEGGPPPRRGGPSGTTANGAGSDEGNRRVREPGPDEVERLAELAREMGQ